MSIFSKLSFLFKKPKVVIVVGEDRKATKNLIHQVLKKYLKIDKDVFIFESELENNEEVEKIKFLMKKSKLPILVATSTVKNEEINQFLELKKFLPKEGFFVFNFDDELKIDDEDKTNCLSFGLKEGADFMASDINVDEETNLKINYKGNVVPVWLKGEGTDKIYSALAVACVGTILDLNLVEISQGLKDIDVKS